MMDIKNNDFRSALYGKYVTTFKDYIDNANSLNFNSEYELFKKRYNHLLKSFPKNSRILDIGCGTGYVMKFIQQEGFNNIFGIDISSEQIEKAKSQGLNAEVYNIFDYIKQNTKRFDIIFAMDLVEHFHKDELLELFTGFNSLLNSNGLIIIHTPNGDGLFHQHIIYGDLTHLTIFNSNSLGQILRLTGFSDIKCFETGPTTKNLFGTVRLILWKIVKLIVQAVRIIETGGTEKILTQDFICVAKKGKGRE